MTDGPSFEAARMEDLPALMAFVDAECAGAGVPEDVTFAIRLAAEEAFTNVVRHGYPDEPGPVRCSFEHGDGAVTFTLVDRAPVFDPLDAPAPDLEAALEDRAEGGLGWHLVRQLMDEVRHEAAPGGGNVLTLVKRLPDGLS